MRPVWSRPVRRGVLWSAWVVVALLLLPVLDAIAYGVVVPLSGLAVALVPGMLPRRVARDDRRDLVTIGGLYLGVVVLMRLVFVGFGTEHTAGLFLCFAAALLLGVGGPVGYTVWARGRTLADLGLRSDDLAATAVLAVLFGGVQFALTLWGYDLPAPVDWVPLLVMALVVGVFESVFFRGFVQQRLEARLGPVGGIAAASVLYGLYHVGYGMGVRDIVFLTGLGVVYAVAFATVRNLLVLWPALTPLGSFYAQVDSGEIELPWASIAGFADVFVVMVLALWLGRRHARRVRRAPVGQEWRTPASW